MPNHRDVYHHDDLWTVHGGGISFCVFCYSPCAFGGVVSFDLSSDDNASFYIFYDGSVIAIWIRWSPHYGFDCGSARDDGGGCPLLLLFFLCFL